MLPPADTPLSSPADERTLSVTELTARIKQVLEQGFSRVRVSGEISRLTRPASGHLYFTIKDQHAAISAVIWRSTAARLSTQPKEGGEFIFSGRLSVYEPRGTYQLIVTGIEPAGAGRLAEEYERRKRIFAERGWFDAARKRMPPELPQHIGIVTSETAAALADVRKVLATRPGWLQLTLSPCLVQGERAAASIARALRRLSELPEPPDVILLVRGGGSIEDLWCFNDEQVVRAIVECPIPVITGIGHEIDVTLADFAADVRAATPSNAVELACPARDELADRLPRIESMANLVRRQLLQQRTMLEHLRHRRMHAWQRMLDAGHYRTQQGLQELGMLAVRDMQRRRARLELFRKRLLPHEPGRRLRMQRQQWQQLHGRLQAAMLQCHQRPYQSLKDWRERLNMSAAVLLHRPEQRLLHQSQRLLARRGLILRDPERRFEELRNRLDDDRHRLLERRRHALSLLGQQLQALGPMQVLHRGYSLNYDDEGRLITAAAALEPGQRLHARFHDGTAHARVETVDTGGDTWP